MTIGCVKLSQRLQHARPEGPHLDVVDGRRVVLAANDRIELDVQGASRLLSQFGADDPLEVTADGTVLLDSAGEYRYRRVSTIDRRRPMVGIYERVSQT